MSKMTPIQFLATNKIIIGEYYADKGHEYYAKKVIGIKRNCWDEWCIVMEDKATFAFQYWQMVRVDAPVKQVEATIVEDNRLEPDAKYYALKERHRVLCDKKLALHDQGRNTTMRHAYISQEQEALRDELRKYKPSL